LHRSQLGLRLKAEVNRAMLRILDWDNTFNALAAAE
jgi:hypothetical protein